MTTTTSRPPTSPDPEEVELDTEITSIRAESKHLNPNPRKPTTETQN